MYGMSMNISLWNVIDLGIIHSGIGWQHSRWHALLWQGHILQQKLLSVLVVGGGCVQWICELLQ